MRNMKIMVKKGRGGWFWILCGSNGRTLATSEAYSSQAKAIKTAKVVGKRMIGVVIL